MMRSTTVNLTMTGVFVLMLLPAAALAQSEDRRGWIYAFAGTGAEDAAWSGTRRQLGGGGDA